LSYFRRLPSPCSSLLPYTTLFRSSAFAIRFSETGCAVPSEFANRDTRSSSSISTTSTQAPGRDTISCDHSALASAGNRLPIFLRSEEHTSELQSRFDLVCRLLLDK